MINKLLLEQELKEKVYIDYMKDVFLEIKDIMSCFSFDLKEEDIEIDNELESFIEKIDDLQDINNKTNFITKLKEIINNKIFLYFLYFTYAFPKKDVIINPQSQNCLHYFYGINEDNEETFLRVMNQYVSNLLFPKFLNSQEEKELKSDVAKLDVFNSRIDVYWYASKQEDTDDISLRIQADENEIVYLIRDIFNKRNIRNYLHDLTVYNRDLRDLINKFIRESLEIDDCIKFIPETKKVEFNKNDYDLNNSLQTSPISIQPSLYS